MTADADPRDQFFDVSHLKKNLSARTGKAASTLLFMSGLRIVLQIASITILARLISPGEYGVFALALPGIVLATALSNFGLTQSIIRDPGMTHRLASSLFWINAFFGLLATLGVAALAGAAAAFFDEPRVIPVLQVISLSVLFAAMAGPYIAIMQRRLQIRVLEIIRLSTAVLALCLAIGAASLGAGYWALVIQQVSGALLVLMVLIWKTGWRPSWPDLSQRQGVLPALQFGGFVAGNSILSQMLAHVGTVIVGRAFDDATTGIYYRAGTLANIPSQRLVTPLTTAFIPALSALQHDGDAFRAMYRRTTNRATLVIMPVAILVGLGAEPLTAILMGPMWAGVVPILTFLSVNIAVAPLTSNLTNVMMALGLGRSLFLISVLRLVITATAMVLAAPYGIMALVMTSVGVNLLLLLPLKMAIVIRQSPLTWGDIGTSGLRELGLAAVIAAGLWAVVPLWRGLHPVLEILALGSAIGLIYAGRILLNPELRRDIRQIVPQRWRKV